MPKIYTRLVLSGGETKGVAQLGALHYFWENGQLNYQSITHYAGASVGSLISLLLVCGYTPFEIWTHVYGIDSIFSLQLPSSSSSLFSSYGLMMALSAKFANSLKPGTTNCQLCLNFISQLKKLSSLVLPT